MNQFRTGLPELAIRRPLLVLVLNLLIVIAGLAAYLGIDVRELPDIDRPIVSVRANLPGGAPETIDAEVTSVLESAVARVSGLKEISSASEENNSRIRLEFDAGTDLDVASADVREAVNRVLRQLPDRVENVFVIKADGDASAIMRLAIVSDVYREEELTQIIETDIAPEIMTIEGVVALQEFGTRERQMRVVVDPLRLSRFSLTIGDVDRALLQAPFDVPVGSFRSSDQELVVRAEATAATAELIKKVTIAGTTTIGDIADVTLAPADASNLLRLDGKPVIGLGIVRQAQSNTISISNAVQAKVRQLNDRFDDLQIIISSDDAVFIRNSVREVMTTLIFTIGIVIITMWLFLGSWKATLVPVTVIPVALVGTLAGIWAFGFSINLLTMLALVLATGLIVDDAIVVLENIQRQQSLGLKRRPAAAFGARQVFFAVIATTAVLVAVFIPISFLPSDIGRLFREFGFVLAFSVIISSFVALSLVPAIAARLNFSDSGNGIEALNRFGRKLNSVYQGSLTRCLDHPKLVGMVCLLLLAGAAGVFTQVDQQLVPDEDRGRISIFSTGPDGVGLAYMERQADQIDAVLQPYLDSGEIESVFTVVGRYDPNRIGISARLAPWDQRQRSQQEIISELREPLSRIPGSRISAFSRGSLSSGRGGREGLEVALTGADYNTIYAVARNLAEKIDTESEILSNPEISYQPTQPQLSIQIDRKRAADLDIPLNELSLTLRAMVGGEDVVDLNVRDQSIPIILEAETTAIQSPSDLRNLFVRSNNGSLVPVSSLATIVEEGIAAELDRFGQRRAIQVQSDVASGIALADAIAEIESLADAVLSDDVNMILQGEAETLEESSKELLITYAFAILIVFLVLVAQFESFSSPVVVMLVVPLGLAAAIFAVFLTGGSLNIYSQIGFILLIGLMAKNGILLVEFADQLRREGQSIREAVFGAAVTRFRPILMTVISTVFGALPLVLASGAGSEARVAIGWVVFGGLGLAAAFNLFLTPVLYLGLARYAHVDKHSETTLSAEMDAAENLLASKGQ
ncbi:MAG: efflux RND transporter permease subunit [Arenicella sp.]|nr:efflux RND transporter permease subunit [Arenicella sp.]